MFGMLERLSARRCLRRVPGRAGIALSARVGLMGQRRLDAEMHWPGLRLPAEERLQARLVWVAEVYGPSDVSGLLCGLSDLGLERWSGDDSLGEQVLEHRRRSDGWSQRSLGILRRPGEAGWFNQIESELPAGALAAMPTLTMLPSSIVVLVVAFLFDEEAGSTVDAVARRDYPSQIASATRQRISYSPPEVQQRDAVRADLARQRQVAHEWLNEKLPGAFARLAPRRQPSAHLLTYRTEAATRMDGLHNTWPWTVEVPREGTAWRATKWPALRLHVGGSSAAARSVLGLFAHEPALLPRTDDANRELDEREAWFQLFQTLGRSLEQTVALHALQRTLALYHAQLADIRDLAFPQVLNPRAAAGQLKRIRDALEVVTDARAVARDLTREQALPAISYDGNDWVSERTGKRLPLLVTMAGGVRRTASDVLSEEQLTRDRLDIETDVFAAGAGIRLQRLGFRVSVLALGTALAALGVALAQVLTA